MTIEDTWPQVLWDELSQYPPDRQFVLAGEWITYITHTLLPQLGVKRRENVLELVNADGQTAASVAAQLGVRRATMARLITEGQGDRLQREREAQAAAAA